MDLHLDHQRPLQITGDCAEHAVWSAAFDKIDTKERFVSNVVSPRDNVNPVEVDMQNHQGGEEDRVPEKQVHDVPEVCLNALFGIEQVNHGDPDEPFVWDNWPEGKKDYRPIDLHLADGSVHLMAQFVWQSSISLAEEIAKESRVIVKDKVVCELGAGAALPGIVSRKLGAKHVIITDYPEEEIVENMRRNVSSNEEPSLDSSVSVKGYRWGTPTEVLLPEQGVDKIDLLIMADTLWMEGQHTNLLTTCRELMDRNNELEIVSTYMNHDDGQGTAKKFFARAVEEFGMEIVQEVRIAWRKDDDDTESDDEDPERYGPVHFVKLVNKR